MNPELPHDPTTTLRLELGRITDQRDAFQKAFSTEVLKVVRVAIIQATIDADEEIALLRERTDNLVIKNNERHAELARLEADNARLKAEVERLTAADSYLQDANEHAFEKRCDELEAEVERLKEGNDCLGQMHDKEMERSAYLLEEFNRTTAWGRGLES
ncbi:hypothetical protein UFOVP549_50, partial [uncultured Caudovirales phage]